MGFRRTALCCQERTIASPTPISPLTEGLGATSFHFLRHGRTDYNLRRIVQGQLDIPLDDTGRAQARAAADVLADAPIGCIVSSDLIRARETAEIVGARLGLSPQFDPAWRERNFGVKQGQPSSPEVWENEAEQMESLQAFADRLSAALLRHVDRPGVLVVAHGGVLRVLSQLLRIELSGVELGNAVPLNILQSGGSWTTRPFRTISPLLREANMLESK